MATPQDIMLVVQSGPLVVRAGFGYGLIVVSAYLDNHDLPHIEKHVVELEILFGNSLSLRRLTDREIAERDLVTWTPEWSFHHYEPLGVARRPEQGGSGLLGLGRQGAGPCPSRHLRTHASGWGNTGG